MTHAVRLVHAAPDAVFGVLRDAWSYPSWVVGASRARAVEPSWPAPGSVLHHSIGLWPLVLDDSTTMTGWDPPRSARLEARGGALGRAWVVFRVKPRGEGCVVRMEEDAASGPALLLPKPVRDVLGHPRTVETLRRLAYLAERRTGL